MASMPKQEILALLTRLRAETKSRAEDGDDLQVMIAIYIENIAPYPADVVRHVLRTQSRHEKFWPAWQDLHTRLELYASYRKRLLFALENPPSKDLKGAVVSEPYRSGEKRTASEPEYDEDAAHRQFAQDKERLEAQLREIIGEG